MPRPLAATLIAASALALSMAGPANAVALLVDRTSATTVYRGATVNSHDAQNIMVRFTLTEETSLTAFEIFTLKEFGTLGEAVQIRLRADVGNAPSTDQTWDFTDTVDSVANARRRHDLWSIVGVRSEFAPISLAAGSYWIGMSSLADELGIVMAARNSLSPYSQYALVGDRLSGPVTSYDMPFRLYDDRPGEFPAPSLVPEPGVWALMISGFGLMGSQIRLVRRRLRQA
jgi:hypothetical protein